MSGGFWAFARAGKRLAEIHLHYESHPRYAGLVWEQSAKPHYRVEKMRPKNRRKIPLSSILGATTDGVGDGATTNDDTESVGMAYMPSAEKTNNDPEITVFDALEYNETLTIRGIPEKAFAYRLGNRSALEWVIDQYQVKTDKRSGITSDPNGYSDDDQYIVKLVERVIQVSVDTVDILEELAKLDFRE